VRCIKYQCHQINDSFMLYHFWFRML
jgi:hypothetical protein